MPSRRHLPLVSGTLVLLVSLGCATPVPADRSTPAPQVTPPSAEAPASTAISWDRARVSHPRLFLREGDDQRLRQPAQDPALADLQRALADQAGFVRTLPPLERVMEGRRLLGVSRAAILRIGTLAAQYRLRGDAAAGQAARTNLLTVVRFSDWNPSHFLDVAEMAFAVALGYDWCHDLLSEEERAEVRQALVTKALEPSFATPQPWWVAGTNNWVQVCHGGLLCAALVLHEHHPDLARRTVERALKHLPPAMDHIYPATGNYPEGPMYWSYGTHYNLIASEALRTVLGADGGIGAHAGLRASALFLAHAHGATGVPFNYGDCNIHIPGWSTNAAALAWFERERGASSPVASRPFPSWKAGPATDNRFLALAAVWKTTPAATALPPRDYRGDGPRALATFRSAWNDPTATYLGITGGSPGINHGHMDTGAFVYERGGIRWAIDLGMNSYAPLEKAGVDLWNMQQDSPRWQVYRLGPEAHSILRLPGGEQRVTGQGVLTAFRDDPTEPGCTLDLSTVYAGLAQRVERTVSLPNRKDLVITDRIEGVTTGGTIRWQWPTAATVELLPEARRIRLTQGGSTVLLQVEEPAVVQLDSRPATPPQAYEAANPGVSIITIGIPVSAGASTVVRVRVTAP